VIRLLRPENPRRKDSETYRRYALYRNGMTIGDFLAAGGSLGDVRWDEKRENIRVEPAKN
jgi:hypothetical protein